VNASGLVMFSIRTVNFVGMPRWASATVTKARNKPAVALSIFENIVQFSFQWEIVFSD
jgi:hypothetical protein